MIELFSEPVKQEPWYYQIDQKDIQRKKSMQLSISDVWIMYEQQYFICDDCGNYLGDESAELIMGEDRIQHIIHIINSNCGRICGVCLDRSFKNGNIIAGTANNDQ